MTRFDALKSLIVPADVIADVGCDHGIIAAYCVRAGLAGTVIASDISEKCLSKAVAALGGEPNVRFAVCDGIKYECDEAVIAGMGGALIADILCAAAADGLLPKTLVLMPHRDADAVRRRLTELGYVLEHDNIIKDGGRFYFAMRAVKGEPAPLSELQYLFGTRYDRPDDVLKEYLFKLYDTYAVAPAQNAQKLSKVRAALLAQGAVPKTDNHQGV